LCPAKSEVHVIALNGEIPGVNGLALLLIGNCHRINLLGAPSTTVGVSAGGLPAAWQDAEKPNSVS
jgi:hypothetical protein